MGDDPVGGKDFGVVKGTEGQPNHIDHENAIFVNRESETLGNQSIHLAEYEQIKVRGLWTARIEERNPDKDSLASGVATLRYVLGLSPPLRYRRGTGDFLRDPADPGKSSHRSASALPWASPLLVRVCHTGFSDHIILFSHLHSPASIVEVKE